MESTLPAACFIRCPNCFIVLAEFPDIPPFKCHACDAILIAEVHSDDASEACLKQISNASEECEKLELVGTGRSEDSKPCEEENLKGVESSGNGMKTTSVSESDGRSSEKKLESAVNKLNDINERSLEQEMAEPTIQTIHNLNQIIAPAANDKLNSNHKLEEQSSESLEHDSKNKEDNEEHKNGAQIKWKTRSSHEQQNHVIQNQVAAFRRTRSSLSYDRSISISDKQAQNHALQKHLALSRRTRSSKLLDSAVSMEAAGRNNNVMKNSSNEEEQAAAEKHELSLISQSNNAGEVVKLHFSEADDQLKILDKFDELKFELLRIISNKSDGKAASGISIKVTQFEGIIETNDNKPSLLRFSKQLSNSSCQDTQIRHCRPVSGGAPFVICYKCYRLLQLPVDFIVTLKRIHKLRCGSCSEVLVYSFRPRPRAAINKRS